MAWLRARAEILPEFRKPRLWPLISKFHERSHIFSPLNVLSLAKTLGFELGKLSWSTLLYSCKPSQSEVSICYCLKILKMEHSRHKAHLPWYFAIKGASGKSQWDNDLHFTFSDLHFKIFFKKNLTNTHSCGLLIPGTFCTTNSSQKTVEKTPALAPGTQRWWQWNLTHIAQH